MKCIFTAQPNGLACDDDNSIEAMKSFQVGRPVLVTISPCRNPGNHRRYFAFIKAAHGMQENYDNQEVFRKMLQLKAGHFDQVVSPEGKSVYLAKSISWGDLDEAEFKVLFRQVTDAFHAWRWPYLSEEEKNRIQSFF